MIVPIDNPRVAIAGLGFGAEFLPIYQRHSNVAITAICQRNQEMPTEIADKFDNGKRFTDYGELPEAPDIDAVHINTPIPDHAAHTLAALRAGKHVACTVPMATPEADCKAIVDLCAETGLQCVMLKTVGYARVFFQTTPRVVSLILTESRNTVRSST